MDRVFDKSGAIVSRCLCCFDELDYADESLLENVTSMITVCFCIQIPLLTYQDKHSICRCCTQRLIESQQFKCLILESLSKFDRVVLEDPVDAHPLSPEIFKIINLNGDPSEKVNIKDNNINFIEFTIPAAEQTDNANDSFDEDPLYTHYESDDGRSSPEIPKKNLSDDDDNNTPTTVHSDTNQLHTESKSYHCLDSLENNQSLRNDTPAIVCRDVQVNLTKLEYLLPKIPADKSTIPLKSKELASIRSSEMVCDGSALRRKSKLDGDATLGNDRLDMDTERDKRALKYRRSRKHFSKQKHKLPTKKRRVFECPFCFVTFDAKSKLDLHLLEHSDAQNFECHHCSKTYKSRQSVIRHLRLKHGQSGKPKGDRPEKAPDRPSSSETNFCCDTCSKLFKTKVSLRRHLATHDRTPRFLCSHCPEMFTDQRRLDTHVINRHDDSKFVAFKSTVKKFKYRCPNCPRTFPNQVNLLRHMMEKEGAGNETSNPGESGETAAKIFKCDRCTKPFNDKPSLIEHLKRHDTKKLRKYKCERCPEKFSSKSRLRAHTQHHARADKFKCPMCPMSFEYKVSLDLHSMSHSGASADATPIRDQSKPVIYYRCPVCDRSFMQKNNMIEHTKVHGAVTNFKCDQCPREFMLLGTLRNHAKTHREKSFECTICGRMFKSNRNVMHHMMSHMGIKDFKCTLCPKAFSSGNLLGKHLTSHDDTRHFQCTQCPKWFKQRRSLLSHQLCHIKTEPQQNDNDTATERSAV